MRDRLPSVPLLVGVVISVLALIVAVGGVTVALTADDGVNQELVTTVDTLESQLLRQALLVEHGGPKDVVLFASMTRAFDIALADGVAQAPAGSAERARLLAQGRLADRWRAAATLRLVSPADGRPSAAAEQPELLGTFRREGAALRRRLVRKRDAARGRAHDAVLILMIALPALVVLGGGGALARRWRRRSARATEDHRLLSEDRRYRAWQDEFTRALQGARSEREAQRMLKRQLERSLAGGSATVLNRNNSDNRLEAVTSVRSDSPLAEAIPDAEPEDCLAVRFGQPQLRAAGTAPLLTCELCGALEGSVTCVPSLVGGKVIGSVLLETEDPLDDGERRRLTDSVTQAAPVLASMRNLRLAETRAATDLLTGLPNRRSAEETLKLLLANADRSVTPLAVAMFDLDHFKKVNDVYGHEKGDQLLAAVGDVATTTTRVSDFVARFGGEEFLVLLPNTDLPGAVLALDKLREGIARLHVLGAGNNPSASFGVAVFPDDGVDAETLVRGADRALYAAKSAGRNCVKALRTLDAEIESSTTTGTPEIEIV
jgi:diguanylate cyclase (GGDEF)-like protein